MRFLVSGLAIILFAYPAAAQGDAPNLGFVIDSQNNAIRPIWGIPGSAFHAAPLDLGFQVRSAAVAPGQRLALLAGDDGLYVLRNTSRGSAAVAVDGAADDSPDLVAVSVSGRFGAAYYASRQVLTMVSPLAAGAPAARDIQLNQLPDLPTALAVADDGRSAVLLLNTAIIRVNADSGALQQIATAVQASSMAMLPGDNDLVVSDRGDGSVFIIRDIAGAAGRSVLLSSDHRLPSPSSVAVSTDGKRVLAASPEGGLALISLVGPDPVFLQCTCSPAGLRPLNAHSVFLVSNVKDGVAWILDWGGTNPRVLFIPPDEEIQ